MLINIHHSKRYGMSEQKKLRKAPGIFYDHDDDTQYIGQVAVKYCRILSCRNG
jgi:hypothetical protein